jgi:hypothetical protein
MTCRSQVARRGHLFAVAIAVLSILSGCDASSATGATGSPIGVQGSAPASLAPRPSATSSSAATPSAEPAATPSPGPIVTPPGTLSATVRQESAVSRIPLSVADRAWEPVVATHPTDANRVAVVYVHRGPGAACGTNPVVRISSDGGRTWRSTRGHPGAGSGRGMGIHAALAWGPGPSGKSRLYWANMTVPSCGDGRFSLSTSYSDDEGTTWSALRVERRTRPWVGGFPDLAVDRDPASPNYGTVYVAYNWLPAGASAPGYRLLASTDFGKTWIPADVPVAARPRGYPESWRIAYRVRTAPDGTVYASWYQVDMRHWDRANIFAKGGPANVGRLAVVIARIGFDRSARRFSVGRPRVAATIDENAFTTASASVAGTGGNIRPDPIWQYGFDVDPDSGRLYLAVGAYGAAIGAAPRGTIRVGRSDDRGDTWTFTRLPALANVAGRRQSSIKPNLVAGRGYVVVTFHSLDDAGANATLGNAFTFSADGGQIWHPPAAISAKRWRGNALGGVVNGIGLRERAERLANGDVFWAYGDGRHATAAATGRTAVYGALIHIAP